MPIPVGAIISGVSALGQLISGGSQKKKANKMLSSLRDPGYKIQDEFKTNLAQAEQLARQGLPAEQYNLATTNIQRGTQAGLRQLGRMSNPFAGIASLTRNQNDALASLDASNAAARRQNILGAMGARRELAGQKLAQQQYAQQRYMDQVNQANALLGAGMQNKAAGLGTIGNIGMLLSMYGGGGAGGAKNPTQALNTVKKPGLFNNPPVDTTNYSFPSWLNMPGVPSYMSGKFGQPNE